MFGGRSSGLDALLHRPRRTPWQEFWREPFVFIARWLYSTRPVVPAEPLANPVSVVCISDTHNSQPDLPDSDLLIHAGDLTQSGSLKELQQAINWLRSQPHRHKVVVAGNHDLLLDTTCDRNRLAAESEKAQLDWGDVTYLEDAETTITCANGRRLRIYGSPKSARHGNWAFQYPRSQDAWASSVPEGVDILITHGPPRSHLDLLHLGCVHLLRELWRVRPSLHVFGHVHEGYGQEWLQFDSLQEAYEQTIIDKGGLWNALKVLREYLSSRYLSSSLEAKCRLVNPSMVGGLRDDQRRRPVKVEI